MDSDPRVTVLVPIFNVEAYLRQCLESLYAQTLSELEVLLLDDGSTDACPTICDEYVARDARFRVVRKSNSGYGATMNLGMREARGEYIGIVEGDDWVEPDMFACLHALACEHDVPVVKSSFYEYHTDGTSKAQDYIPSADAERVICPADRSAIFYRQPAIWNGIYGRRFLTENGIDFLETPGASYQDISFNFKVLMCAEKVWLSSRAFYHYRMDSGSSSVRSRDKVFYVVDEWNEIERFVARNPEAEKSSYLLRLHLKWTNYMWNWGRLRGERRTAFEPVIIDAFAEAYHRNLLCYGGQDYGRKKWTNFRRIMAGHSWSARCGIFLTGWLYRVLRLFYKRKLKDDIIEYYFLCDLICIRRKARPEEMLPNFHRQPSA